MPRPRKRAVTPVRRSAAPALADYDPLLVQVSELIQHARHAAARAVNATITATYWEIGRVIVEHEQKGARRAVYGEQLIARLAVDLTERFGRGFSRANVAQMRRFYEEWPIIQTASGQSPQPRIRETASEPSPRTRILQTASGKSVARPIAIPKSLDFQAFPLPWSHYVLLLGVGNANARAFYETEAVRGGWTVRQLKRQISTQFYERTALSRNKAAMLRKGEQARSEDAVTPEEELKDPLVLEFLGLKDEYSENELEAALIHRLEEFLLELGGDFAFIGRQRRLRVGDAWYRIDLLFFHRTLRCLVVIDLKIGELDHADAGQMHLYLNYAREHWTRPGENPPVGLILCAKKNAAVAKYALEGLPNKVLAAEYRTALPDERRLADEMAKVARQLESRKLP